jgi:hypothetical protein
MIRTRPLALLATLAPALLLATTANAEERACYQLARADTPEEHDPSERLSWPEGATWEVVLLASLSVRHTATSAPRLEVTLDSDLQGATVERASEDGTPGPVGHYAWSRPPDVWCSDVPASLEMGIQGQGESLRFSTFPAASVVMDGVTRVDDEILSVQMVAPGLRQTRIPVAPRVDGPPEFTLLVTVAPDLQRPDLVLPIHHHYVRMPTADGAQAGGPTPPPILASSEPPDAELGEGDPPPVGEDEGEEQAETEGEAPAEEEHKKSYLGDVSSGWFHLGGGGALIRPGTDAFTGGGRFALGFGGYTFFFYGGAGFEMDFSPVVPLKTHGVAYLGVHIPIPVVHPLIGVKVAGGMAADPLTGRVGPSLGIGGQAGLIIRAFDGRGGFRFMVEPTFGLTGMGDDVSTFELWFVAAAVF